MGIAKRNRFLRLLARSLAVVLSAALLIAAGGCGDEEVPLGPAENSVQGVWEGTLLLSTADTVSTDQSNVIRLELLQQDFAFEGYLLKFDPFSLGQPQQAVDTLLVRTGSVSANFVSFQVIDPAGGTAFFEGNLRGNRLSGSAIGAGYNGNWSVEYVF